MTHRKPVPKPEISVEARGRIADFVRAVAAAEKYFDVEISCEDGALALFDARRTDEWITTEGDVYGNWDAMIYAQGDNFPSVNPDHIEFEDFDGWDK